MMNKAFIYILTSIAFLWGSCDEQVFDPILNVGPASSLTTPSSGASFVLEEEKASQVMTTFEWTKAEFGFSAAVTYTLQIDFAGNDFGSALTLGATTALSMSVTQEKVNNILLASGIEQAEPVAMEVRVVSEINDDVEPTISAPVSLTVTPFIVEVIFPQLQVPGSYQGWDPANNQTVIYSLKSDGKFEGFIYFDSDGALYKFTDGPSWDINWGDDGLDGTLDRNGTDIPIPVMGIYRLKCRFECSHAYFNKNRLGSYW
ncbi:MAG: SusE domain-containing protein [Saprospiraceae bacterium]|nr:SusE domain-containing protein [Saprospiraceae bacterium]